MAEKDVLKLYGENTAHSAKSHFKAADLRRNTNMFLIISIAVISVLNVSNLIPNPLFNKIIGVLALAFSVILLILQVHDGKNNHILHKQVAEEYLKLHYDIYHAYNDPNLSDKKITELKNRMNDLNSSSKPFVPYIAKKLAVKAIEEKEEIRVWWK